MKEQRQKFLTRSILLRSDVQVYTVNALIKQVPLDPDKPIEVLIREQPRQRGLDQNGLYHLRLDEIEAQGWFHGKQFAHELWHIYCGKKIMPEIITTKDGEERSKWIELPDGELTVISTTQLEKKCFADYTTAVEAFGADLGVHFSARPNRG